MQDNESSFVLNEPSSGEYLSMYSYLQHNKEMIPSFERESMTGLRSIIGKMFPAAPLPSAIAAHEGTAYRREIFSSFAMISLDSNLNLKPGIISQQKVYTLVALKEL